MIYNDNSRTTNNATGNNNLRREAERDTALAKQKMQIEEQRRKKLKADDKKREIDELTRKISLKESLLRTLNLESFSLNAKKQKEERELGDAEQKSKSQSYSAGMALAEKTTTLKKIEQDIDMTESEISRKKADLAKKTQDKEILKREIGNMERELVEKTTTLKKIEQDIDMTESEISRKKADLAKKTQTEETLKREAGNLERESKMSLQPKSEAILTTGRNNIMMVQRRIIAVNDDIQKGTNEIANLKSELQKKNGELRALAG